MVSMDRAVNRRTYDATHRQARSAETRRRVLEAARRLILENGYRATKIADIAVEAGVNLDTVYELVGRKSVVLRELIEQAISGTDTPVIAEERDYVKAILREPDPAKKLSLYANAVCNIQGRMAPLFLALRDASSTEPEAHQVWLEISERRADNMRKLLRDIRATGRLRAGLSVDQAADVVWAMNSSELYVLLTVERGWSSRRYARWLADAWCRLLLD
jgi:AcrR family transcriptional regulator